MHQPLGLIFPVTIVQAFGALKNRQPAHFWPFFPGLSWYLYCFLLSAASTGASVALAPSATAGIAAIHRRADARDREDFIRTLLSPNMPQRGGVAQRSGPRARRPRSPARGCSSRGQIGRA